MYSLFLFNELWKWIFHICFLHSFVFLPQLGANKLTAGSQWRRSRMPITSIYSLCSAGVYRPECFCSWEPHKTASVSSSHCLQSTSAGSLGRTLWQPSPGLWWEWSMTQLFPLRNRYSGKKTSSRQRPSLGKPILHPRGNHPQRAKSTTSITSTRKRTSSSWRQGCSRELMDGEILVRKNHCHREQPTET